MSLHAVDNVGDALDAAKEFLLPFDRGRWLRLTVISLFVGGVGGFSGFQGGGSGSPDGTGFGGFEFDPLPGLGEIPTIVFVVAAVLVFLAVVLLLVSSVMEFVLIQALATETVAIRGPFREQVGNGLSLFAFRVALFLAAFVLIVVPILALLGFFGVSIVGFLLLIPMILLGFVVLGVVHGFTTAFVVPIMVDADTGVIGGWRRFSGILVSEPVEYLVYLVLSVILGMVGGVGISILVAIASLVVLIPLGGIALATYLLVGFSLVGLAVIVPALLLLGFLVMVFYAAASVPVLVYLRYYALLELGDTSEHDLIPERRAEIRAS